MTNFPCCWISSQGFGMQLTSPKLYWTKLLLDTQMVAYLVLLSPTISAIPEPTIICNWHTLP